MSREPLERRYRMLLRAYPADYRRERGDELLDTLLTDETDRQWPSLRQATALIRGGLRVRAGATTPRPVATVWWQGAHMAALIMLAYASVTGLRRVQHDLSAGQGQPWLMSEVIAAGLITVTLLALAAGADKLAAGLVVVAVAIPTALSSYTVLEQASSNVWWASIMAVPLILVGLRRPSDVPPVGRATRWLLAAGFGGMVLLISVHWMLPQPLGIAADAIAMVALLLWGVGDLRLLVAVAAFFTLPSLSATSYAVSRAMEHVPVDPSWIANTALMVAVVGALAVTATVQARRRARV